MSFHKDRVPISERLLIEAVGEHPATAVLCTSLGRGQLAAALSTRMRLATVHCHFLDIYRAEKSMRWLASRGARVTVVCTADFPEREFDLVALPCTARGDGELTRDLLQTGFQRLGLGGRLFVATDNPRDTWLGDQMASRFRKVLRSPTPLGVVYSGVKTEPLRKVKNYSCEFVFRDGPRLIRTFSRPGVFSHRRLDVGARALIESMEVQDGQRVLDLGCGAGVVSLAAAQRAQNVIVTAIDANPRAIECTQRSAELNALQNITTILNADAESDAPGTYGLVLANPPYYSHFRIGEIFVRGAERALQGGGVLQLVTKQSDRYLSLVQAGFRDATVTPVRQYQVVRAVRAG